MKPTLHALLITIGNYPDPEDCLQGPPNDLGEIKTHLAAFCIENGFNPPIFKELSNADATRQNIIDGYQHFLAANPGDTCLVYYSGHGFRMDANPAFWLEPNGKHEALFCFDARALQKGVLDKELAWLGWKYVESQADKNLHFVEIFDCCHAGGITRSAGGETATARARQSFEDVRLEVSAYLGIEDYTGYAAFAATGKGKIHAPVARRIQLAASRSEETAKEDYVPGGPISGFFTTALCRTLKEVNYRISYNELMDRAFFKVREFVLPKKVRLGEQSPIMDWEQEDPWSSFGTGKPDTVRRSFVVAYENESKHWLLRAGSAAGIPSSGKTSILIDGDETPYPLGTVYPDVSVVNLDGGTFKKTKTYAAVIHSMQWDKKIKAAFAPYKPEESISANVSEEAIRLEKYKLAISDFQADYDGYFASKPPLYFDWTNDPEAADLHLVHDNGAYYFTEKGSPVPLFKRAGLTELPSFFEMADKAAKWFLVARLDNPTTSLDVHQLELEVVKYEAESGFEPVPVNWKKEVVCSYGLSEGKLKQPRLSLSVRNKTGKQVWVSIVALSPDFSIGNEFIQSGKTSLEPGGVARLAYQKNGEWLDKVPLSITDVLKKSGATEGRLILKVFVSTKEISTDSFRQTALPVDLTYFEGLKSSAKGKSGGITEDEDPEPEIDESNAWLAFTVGLKIVYKA